MRVLSCAIAALVLISTSCLASSPIGMSWKSLSFVTNDDKAVEIVLGDNGRSVDKLSVREASCANVLRSIKVPGLVDLNGVSYLEDEDDHGPINILVIPYVVDSGTESRGEIVLIFRDCKLISKDAHST